MEANNPFTQSMTSRNRNGVYARSRPQEQEQEGFPEMQGKPLLHSSVYLVTNCYSSLCTVSCDARHSQRLGIHARRRRKVKPVAVRYPIHSTHLILVHSCLLV